jgi:hypothetical protein
MFNRISTLAQVTSGQTWAVRYMGDGLVLYDVIYGYDIIIIVDKFAANRCTVSPG